MAIIRPANVMGRGQKELETIMKLIEKRILPLLGKKTNQTSICFVEDVISSLFLAAKNEKATGQTYFVTNDHYYSWREMLNFIAKTLHGGSPVFKLPHPLLYMTAKISGLCEQIFKTPPLISGQTLKNLRKYYWLYSGNKIQRELGFTPKINFEAGMKRIIDWYQDNKLL